MKAASESTRTDAQVRQKGLEALVERLGARDALRFLMHYEPGSGDYTRDRHRWLDNIGMNEALQKIRAREQSGGSPA